MQPSYDGIYRALVTNNIDTTNQGKIRVQCPQVAGAAEIRSAEAANPGMPVPLVNSLVWIYFNGGDITKPVYMANAIPTIPEFQVLLPWTTPTLASGFTGNGNSNGTVMYRVLDMLGYNFVQWRGGLNVTYPSSTIANGGVWHTTALNSLAVPASGLRTVAVSCSASASSVLSVKIDFSASGFARIVGVNTTTIQPPWVSLTGVNYFTF